MYALAYYDRDELVQFDWAHSYDTALDRAIVRSLHGGTIMVLDYESDETIVGGAGYHDSVFRVVDPYGDQMVTFYRRMSGYYADYIRIQSGTPRRDYTPRRAR